jgi:hypothetical protein
MDNFAVKATESFKAFLETLGQEGFKFEQDCVEYSDILYYKVSSDHSEGPASDLREVIESLFKKSALSKSMFLCGGNFHHKKANTGYAYGLVKKGQFGIPDGIKIVIYDEK